MKFKIKLKKENPKNEKPFGRFLITDKEKTLDLNDEEVKALDSAGAKVWFDAKKIRSRKKD